MAANNGAGRGGNQMNGNEHVEFSVKAEEDLYLTGSENTIRRVTAETNYSCLMLKSQRFSSLFRHYAKYHGLRKDDLEYYFVNLLENEDTPETVQLQRGDTIMVRKRRKAEPPDVAADDDNFYKDFRELLEDEEHMDAVFLVHRDNNSLSNAAAAISSKIKTEPGTAADLSSGNFIEIRGHRAILTARAEYFKALFRTNASSVVGKSTKNTSGTAFRESEDCFVRVEPMFTEQHIKYVLEFVYTNRIQQIRDISTDDLLFLLNLSDRWLLRDLKRYIEHEMIRSHISNNTVARMYGATEQFSAKRLSAACFEYIMTNLRSLATNANFMSEMKNYPHLCIPVLKAAADLIPDGPVHKKQRTEHHNASGNNNNNSNTTATGTPSSTGAGGLRSSPVPDSDT